MSGEVEILLVACAAVAFVLSIAYWKPATLAAMLLVIFEGVLRKWVLPEAQAQLYLAKDVILLGAYIGFAVYKAPRVRIPHAGPFIALLAVTAVYGAAQVFNPALPTIVLGVVGWRAYFFYVPLIFVVPHLCDSPEDLVRLLRRFAYVAIPVALLGLLQFYSPADSFINVNVQHEEGGGAAIGFGSVNRVRVAGTFSFVSGFAAYLLAAAMALAASLAVDRWRWAGNASMYAALALVIAAMFATGSRGPVFSLALAAVLYAAISVLNGEISVASAVKATLAAVVLAAAVTYFMPEPAEAFRSRAAGEEDVWARALSPLTEPFAIMEEGDIMGFGIGAAHQSAFFFTGSMYPWWTNGMFAEAETSRVTLEMGVLGLVLVWLFRIGIAVLALRASFELRLRSSRVVALAIALFLGLQIFGAVIFNPTMNPLYWFAVGALFALYRFEVRGAAVPVRPSVSGRPVRDSMPAVAKRSRIPLA